MRAINPDIISVVGGGFGSEGPDTDKGGDDSTVFWARGGSAFGTMSAGSDRVGFMPAGAYGDSIGGLTVAGGIAAAVAAEYFDIYDDGYAASVRVIVPEGAENLAIEAVAACPERAIQICEASQESKSARRVQTEEAQ